MIRDEDRTEPGYTGNDLVNFLIVTGFREDEEGKLIVRGKIFKRPREAHSDCKNKLRYLALDLLGMHEVYKHELCEDFEYECDFDDMVIGKCFPFHMVLTRGTSDRNPVGDNCSQHQKWIFIREMHTRSPQSLWKPNDQGRKRRA